MDSTKTARLATRIAAFLTLLFMGAAAQAATPSAGAINAGVASALSEFHKEVPGADEYLREAKGVLVIPDVKKVGFVVAAQWGTGALQVQGKSVSYYKMEAGSAGFQAGYQKTNLVFIFFTDDALSKFRSSNGWTVGAEAGLTFVEVGAGVKADTLRNQNAVGAFAFGTEGLMAGWSARGSKFSLVQPDQ